MCNSEIMPLVKPMGPEVARPVPDAMAEVQAAAAKVNALIDGWQAAGEIEVRIDVLKWGNVFVLHIPLPQ